MKTYVIIPGVEVDFRRPFLMIIVGFAFISACTTTEPPRTITDVQTQVFHIPTPTPCEAVVPPRPPSVMPKPDANGKVDVEQGTAGALADLRELRDPGKYLDQIDAIIKKCVKAPSTTSKPQEIDNDH